MTFVRPGVAAVLLARLNNEPDRLTRPPLETPTRSAVVVRTALLVAENSAPFSAMLAPLPSTLTSRPSVVVPSIAFVPPVVTVAPLTEISGLVVVLVRLDPCTSRT